MILKICNVRNFDRSRMSHGLLADSVDTTLASVGLVVQQLWYSVNYTIS